MAKDAIIHVRIGPEEKEAAEQLFASMGTSLSEAIRVFVGQCVRDRRLPFVPSSASGKGKMSAQAALGVYAHHEMREAERESWIRSLSDKYETFNR